MGKLNTQKIVILLYVLIYVFGFTGCSFEKMDNKKKDVIDITVIEKFTDDKINEKGYQVIQRSITQRTDDTDTFIVEYWYNEQGNDTEKHYGYYVGQDAGECYIISEGESITKDYLVNQDKYLINEAVILIS